MRKSVIAAVVGVVVLVGAAVVAVPILERHAAGEIKRNIERAGDVKVGAVEVGLFERRVKLVNIKSSGRDDLSVGRLEASGLAWPLGELLQGRTPFAGFDWGDPLQAGRIELERVHGVDQGTGGRWSADALVVEDVDLARYDGKYQGAYAGIVLTVRTLGALSLRRLELRNAIVTLPGAGDTIGAASIAVDGYAKGRLSSLAMASLEATPKAGVAPFYSVAETKIAGLDFSRLVTAMSSQDWAPGTPVGRIEVAKASATGFGGETLKRYGISLAGMSFDTVHDGDKVLRAKTRIDGFVMSPPLSGLEGLSLRMALQSMGLKEIKASFECDATEDRGKGELSLDRCALTGPDLGEIGLSGRVSGADAAFWRAVDNGDSAAMLDSTAALASAKLVVADKSLLERSLKALSMMGRQPLDATRANLARDLRRYQPPGILITQAMTDLLDVVARFVEQGGTLTIEAKPERPLGFDRLAYLASPGADLVSALGMSATLKK